jgi:hypothetical protein
MKMIYLFSCLFLTNITQAQLLTVSAGTDLTIVSGTIFMIDSFALTPSANYIISNNTLTKSTTITHPSENPYISRVYQFNNNANPFSGSVQFNYTDGAELNSIPENVLTLNVHNGTAWTAWPATTRDGVNNFILTNGLSAVDLNEMTLANEAAALPLQWLSFTVTRQNQTAFLKWTTAQEQNTRNFVVQHSTNGINWTAVGALPAAGNSSIAIHYSYVHNRPAPGINYYRILQTDLDNRGSYSGIKALRFTKNGETFTLIGNPVTNNVLIVQVNTATGLALYAPDGKLLWLQQVHTGIMHIDVSRYAKGTYLLKNNSTAQKVLIR